MNFQKRMPQIDSTFIFNSNEKKQNMRGLLSIEMIYFINYNNYTSIYTGVGIKLTLSNIERIHVSFVTVTQLDHVRQLAKFGGNYVKNGGPYFTENCAIFPQQSYLFCRCRVFDKIRTLEFFI